MSVVVGRVIATRREKRGKKTFTVTTLAPGKARGSKFFPQQAWKKPMSAKGAGAPSMIRGDRVFHRGLETQPGQFGRSNDERAELLRPDHPANKEAA